MAEGEEKSGEGGCGARVKKETVNLLKFKKLQAMGGFSLWEATGLLQALWLFAARETPQGDIGRFSNEDIAYAIEFPLERIDRAVEVLVATRWLDASEVHRLVVHDWRDHCEDAVKMRLVRAGLPFADGTPAKASRMATSERARHEHGGDTAAVCGAHGVRTACARDGDGDGGVRTTDTDTDTRTETKPIPIPEPRPARSSSAESSSVSDSAAGDGARKALWARLQGVVLRRRGEQVDSRDPPEYREWWRTVCASIAENGGLGELEAWVKYAEDCGNPAIRKAKDLGELKRPSAWIAGKCRDFLEQHGVRLPAPPGKMSA